MKRIIIAACVFFVAGGMGAGVIAQTPRNLLHQFSKEMVMGSLAAPGQWHPWPTTPEGWKEVLGDSTAAAAVRKGEEAMGQEFMPLQGTIWLDFVRTGNRVDFESQSFVKRTRLMDLALAEAVEGKGRFCDAILNGVWSICEETFWGLPAHVGMQKAGKGLPDASDPIVDLFAAETASVLALTDYLAGDGLHKISPLVHERICNEVRRRIFEPIIPAKYEYMGYGDYNRKVNNWAPWIMSNYLMTALLLEKDPVKRGDAVMRAMKYIDQYLNGLGDDGASDEGPLYWFAAGGTVFDALNVLYDASGGKLSVFKEPFVRKMAAYVYKMHIADRYFVNIADATPEINADGVMLYRCGMMTGDEDMKRFGSWAAHHIDTSLGFERFFRGRTLYNLMAAKACAGYPEALPTAAPVWFGDIEVMDCRLNNGLFVASHGGNNGESHNHNDVGDFMIYYNGEPVLIDAGAGTYTSKTFSSHRYELWFNTSAYHNLPTVNGVQQGGSLAYKATNVHYTSDGKAVDLSMDIAKAYDSSAGIRSWVRKVHADIVRGEIVVNDAFVMAAAGSSITQSLMTVCDVELGEPGKLIFTTWTGEKVVLEYDAAMWKAEKEEVVLEEPEDEKIRTSWHGRKVWRILLKNGHAGKEGRGRMRVRQG